MKTTSAWMLAVTTRFAGLLSSFTPPTPFTVDNSILVPVLALCRSIPTLNESAPQIEKISPSTNPNETASPLMTVNR